MINQNFWILYVVQNWNSYVVRYGKLYVVTILEIIFCTIWEVASCYKIESHILYDVGCGMVLRSWKSYVVRCGKSYIVVETKLSLRFWHKVVIWESVKKWQFCIGICYSVVHYKESYKIEFWFTFYSSHRFRTTWYMLRFWHNVVIS